MDDEPNAVISEHGASPGTVVSYTLGFLYSLVLTLAAYFIVTNHVFGGGALIAAVSSLGLAQLFVQLFCFLHLGRESKPRWNVLAFLFAVLVVLIVVAGSLWIMHNLHYNMSPMEMGEHLLREEGVQR